MKTILAPVDFSAVTPRVIAEAAALARAQAGRVVLLNVTQLAVGVVDFAVIFMATAQINEAAAQHARERLVNRTLRSLGWRVLRVWEHELVRRNEQRLIRRLAAGLGRSA